MKLGPGCMIKLVFPSMVIIFVCFLFDFADSFMFIIEHIMPMMLVVSWVYYVAMFTQSIVYEKEVRLKEVSTKCCCVSAARSYPMN